MNSNPNLGIEYEGIVSETLKNIWICLPIIVNKCRFIREKWKSNFAGLMAILIVEYWGVREKNKYVCMCEPDPNLVDGRD